MSTDHSFHSTATVDNAEVIALLEDVVRAIESDHDALPDGVELDAAATFARAYYADAIAEDLIVRSADDLAAIARTHLDFGAERAAGKTKVSARSTSAARASVDIVTDDKPFLVDSVIAEILRRGYTVRFLVHPVLNVTRDRAGRFGDAVRRGETAGGDESWIHVDVIGPQSEAAVDELAEALRSVLADVEAAVADWKPMVDRASAIVDELRESPPHGIAEVDVEDGIELLEWLVANHFTFLGYREYRLRKVDGVDALQPVQGTGLGLLRLTEPQAPRPLPGPAAAKAREKRLLNLTKASSRSTVHRNAYLDYIGVKIFNANGDVVGERRFLGLLTSAAYRQRLEGVPVIRRKVREVLKAAGFPAGSHVAKDLRDVLESLPRDQLLQAGVEEILALALAVMRLPERRLTRLFLRRDDYGRYYTALVFLSRDRYSTPVRLRMTEILMSTLGGTSYDYSTRAGEGPLARLEFVIRVPDGAAADTLTPEAVAELQAQIVAASRSWDDDLADVLRDLDPREQASIERFADAMPAGYRAAYGASAAVADIDVLRGIEQVDASSVDAVGDPAASAGMALRLALPGQETGHIDVSGADELQRDAYRLKIYTIDRPVLLSEVLPILQHLGMEVSDEDTFDFDVLDGDGNHHQVWIYDFAMTATAEGELADDLADRLTETIAAAWSGVADSDGLNALISAADLTWRQVALLRAYVRYLRMGALNYSRTYVEQALVGNPRIVRRAVALFSALFDPAYTGNRTAEAARLRDDLTAELAEVASLEQDRILSALMGAIDATLRTDFYQGAPHPHEAITLKLDPKRVPDLPEPRPYREIWVYSPRFEGVHLRFGEVARGGLRWSDRREDMRTEILGLVKAQMVKNTVIVPTGAKGGFLAKRLPDPQVDREAWSAEGVACYREFIRAMLRITDNRVSGAVVSPTGVVRRDGDDPYLVVAADKGTASFSDFANTEAIEAGFWLGDAFASGGSVGYDHKAMGITARGAWESVKRHFRELGIDTQTTDFTAVGIGDMSGDVFGNGMLLSRHIKLVGAFDHRHIFVDPNPDAAASYAERERLFALPRSSWDDYDRTLISAGGGVFPRTAKSIPITAEVRTALGLAASVEHLTPNELIRAVLLAPVDLLWNGGIGTYVKSSQQSNADVGDRANDAIRVDGRDLRCRVVGEGGNLGCTQLGRVEYALHGKATGGGPETDEPGLGGKINTDAIDNSAGVDTSDHEVNIKILLARAIEAGELEPAARADLLRSMTDEIAAMVLEDNYDQNVTLQVEEANSLLLADAHRRLIGQLEESGLLNRALELLPTDSQLRERNRAGRGLTSPELAVLLAYSKLLLEGWVLDSDLPEDPAYQHLLTNYFPEALHTDYPTAMSSHPLRRQIIATLITNRIINNAGPTGPMRMIEETGAAPDAVFRAQTAGNRIFDLPGLFDAVTELDNVVPSAVQTSLRNDVQRLVERSTRWMLRNLPQPVDVVQTVEAYADGVAQVREVLPAALKGVDQESFAARAAELSENGVPDEAARRFAALPKSVASLDIIGLARSGDQPIAKVASAYCLIADELQLSRLLELIIHLPRDARWRSMARGALRDDLNGAHAELTAAVLAHPGTDVAEQLAGWQDSLPRSSRQALEMLASILSMDTVDLAAIVVAVQLVRSLVVGTVTTH
ncbi:NAD-glutamate dehydrogenase [Cumulibacter soli]|uniref:NAD-glutamate dehydrogenase n=1 Tax=Cumulibacter soli TaxID=2546344 RepID=UPI001067EF16|nr:NAD-glutamate dehydrogenase [Cumulibacter soli]